eukprot:TRINITY_DN75888_c0_g1_i1.p1 TRINITY_DN75888_c0_g1~~TRINITY_DN75888_c0_g1_i1.p1  ORF type:complete len:983 (+),score=180.84 TRINITY_DN75888_c0_g1_i1:20-2968(+)
MPPHQRLDHAVAGYAPKAASHKVVDTALCLPGEQGALTLHAPAIESPSASASVASSVVSRNLVTYRWTQFHGQEETTEFDLDNHFQLEGHFECNSSSGHKEYQDRLRAIHFRTEGKSKSEIATILGRSDKFVAKWWQKEVKEVPRPYGVHAYLSFDNGGAFGQGAKRSADSAMDAATHWRDVEIRRGFAKDPDVYDQLMKNSDWKQAEGSTTRDFRTGARHLKYDKEGNIKLQGYMRAKYQKGQSPAFDNALQKLFATYGIEDRTSGVLLNYYEDGKMMLGSHRHDCWTALFSFGSDRILTIDKTPVLCRDGDLINFGTQRHGVPLMPDIAQGRITVPVFFYPDKLAKQAMWQTITEAEDSTPSSKFANIKKSAGAASNAVASDIWTHYAAEMLQLCQAGFCEDLARDALIAHGFDVAKAHEALLGQDLSEASRASDGINADFIQADTIVLHGSSGGGRWRRGRASADCDQASSSSMFRDQDLQGDEAAALAMQFEDMTEPSALRLPLDDDEAASQAAALALHLDELENGSGFSSEVLQAQFQQYDAEIDRLDAEERWNGTNGDLMAFRSAQENLTLEDMEKVELFSVGHGDMTERAFFEILQLNSIRVLYDTRPTDYRHELVGIPERFTVQRLKTACKARGIFYKQMIIGRESAYGTLAHLRSQQGKHVLVELAWQGKRKPSAFLGRSDDWRQDPRLAIAQDLCAAGHAVKHVLSDGSCEAHISMAQLPDWLQNEEERLRKTEKQRQAGELKRPEKSAVDRSSESVASKLMRPAQEIDAMTVLQDAENQNELKLAQQKLVRIQRIAEKKQLPGKVLSSTPQFIKDEARAQADWIAQRKSEKQQKGNDTVASSAMAQGAGKDDIDTDLQVECSGCGSMHVWAELQNGDGRCATCCSTSSGTESASCVAGLTEAASPESGDEELMVECQKCSKCCPWRLLALGDGSCPECFENAATIASDSLAPGGSGSWRARRRQAATSSVS